MTLMNAFKSCASCDGLIGGPSHSTYTLVQYQMQPAVPQVHGHVLTTMSCSHIKTGLDLTTSNINFDSQGRMAIRQSSKQSVEVVNLHNQQRVDKAWCTAAALVTHLFIHGVHYVLFGEIALADCPQMTQVFTRENETHFVRSQALCASIAPDHHLLGRGDQPSSQGLNMNDVIFPGYLALSRFTTWLGTYAGTNMCAVCV
jgi:hypothetical protein